MLRRFLQSQTQSDVSRISFHNIIYNEAKVSYTMSSTSTMGRNSEDISVEGRWNTHEQKDQISRVNGGKRTEKIREILEEIDSCSHSVTSEEESFNMCELVEIPLDQSYPSEHSSTSINVQSEIKNDIRDKCEIRNKIRKKEKTNMIPKEILCKNPTNTGKDKSEQHNSGEERKNERKPSQLASYKT